jgi:hypothetical protein
MSFAIPASGSPATAPARSAHTDLTAQAAPDGPTPAPPNPANPPRLTDAQMKALREECAAYRQGPESQSPPTDLVGELGTPRVSCTLLDMMDALRAMPEGQK